MHPVLFSFVSLLGGAAALSIPRAPANILIGNDDGWATANIRALFSALEGAGFPTVISAPAENKSGSSSFDWPPSPVGSGGGQFGTIPPNSPPTGFDPTNDKINYVNSFPVTAVKHGISVVAPREFGGKPDLIVTGPNVGSNLNIINQFSGTVGAAVEGAKQGIPSIAFSGVSGEQHSFTEPDAVAPVYAELALKVVQTILATPKPYLPPGVILNVNLGASSPSQCSRASDYKFIFTRVNIDINPLTDDVQHCGTNHLPTESSVVKDQGSNCHVSISVLDTKDKFDVDKDIQKIARDKLLPILSCRT